MTKRTTMNRLRSYHQMVISNMNHEDWYTNPRLLPLPTLPEDLDQLEDQYLKELRRSAPGIVEIARNLIDVVRGVREGRIPYRGRR